EDDPGDSPAEASRGALRRDARGRTGLSAAARAAAAYGFERTPSIEPAVSDLKECAHRGALLAFGWRQSIRRRVRITSSRKNGTPSSAVTTPTLISVCVGMSRTSASAINSKAEPARAEGSSRAPGR